MHETLSQDTLPPSEDWIEAARLLKPQGRRGELLAEPAIDTDLFTPGRTFALATSASHPILPIHPATLEAAWKPTGRNAGRLVLQLGGTDSISAAEALAGHFLLLRASELPVLEEGTYRVRDLIGCTLYDTDQPVGTVTDLQFPISSEGRRLPDAPDLLVVEPLEAPGMTQGNDIPAEHPIKYPVEPVLVPFVRAWLLEVDLPARRLRMQLPAGLFADAEE